MGNKCHHMKKLVLLTFTLYFLNLFSIDAQVIPYSAEITYSASSQQEYDLTLSVIQACNGNTIPNTAVVTIRNGNQTNPKTLTKYSSEDISPVCESINSACTGGTGASTIGITKTIYKGSIDLGDAPYVNWLSNGACELIFSYSLGYRNQTSNIVSSYHYIESQLNYCNVLQTSKKWNNSIAFNTDPVFYLPIQFPFKSGYLAKDKADKDSLSFALVTPKTSYNNIASYKNNFTARYPLSCKCIPNGRIDCYPVPNASPSLGTYFNSNTGELIYTPIIDEVPTIAIETIEWRKDAAGKYIEVGRVTRDYIVHHYSSSNNMPPNIIAPKEDYFVWLEDSLDIEIISDDNLNPTDQNGKKDTTTLFWDNGIETANFTITNPQARLKEAIVSWRPKPVDLQFNPHRFNVVVKDDACPQIAENRQGFSVYVIDSNNYDIASSFSCNFMQLKTIGFGTMPASIEWHIKESGTSNQWKTYGYSPSVELESDGKYYIQANVTLGGNINFSLQDTLDVMGTEVKPDLGLEKSIGVFDSLTLNAGSNFTSYLWSNGSTDSTITLKAWELQKNNTIEVAVTKSNGCTYNSSVIIKVNCNAGNTIDMGEIHLSLQDSFTLQGSNKASSYFWSNGKNTKEVQFYAKDFGMHLSYINLNETYSNGCKDNYQFNINVICDQEEIYQINELGADTSILYNHNIVLRTQENYESYSWQDGSSEDTFLIVGKNYTIGTQTYRLTAISSIGCTYTDSIKVENKCLANTLSILDAKDIDIWDSTTLIANGEYTNYQWSNGITTKNNTIHGFTLGEGLHKITLNTVDEKGCTYSAYAHLNVTNLTSIKEEEENWLVIYPSPAKDKIQFVLPQKIDAGLIEIMDLQGKVVYSQNIEYSAKLETININIENLAKAPYFLTITNSNGMEIYFSKFIKN